MDENTGRGPLRGLDDVDWTGLVPDEGARIPELLRTVAAGGTGSMDAVSALFDILRHPGPGYLAAPQAAPFLARIAADEATGAPAEALSLLFELVVPVPAAVVPEPWDGGQWADEVAWATASDVDAVRDQYLKWREDAPDEQAFRRMSARYDAVARDTGAALLKAELDVREAVRPHVPDLVGLLEGRENRSGLNSTAEWAASILAFLPEARDEAVPAILRGRGLLEPEPEPETYSAALQARESWRKPLSAELFALGMLAGPADADTTVALAGQLSSGNLYTEFAAASALAMQHGERVPHQAVERMRRHGRTRVGHTGLFDDSWPHPGEAAPVVLGYLALGRCGEAAAELRAEILPEALRAAGALAPAVVGSALEEVLGPRSAPQDAAEAIEAADTGDDERDPGLLLRVLWAVAELPASAWEEAAVGETAAAWGLPADRDGFREYVGVGADTADEEEPEEQAPAAPAAPQREEGPGGLFARLFGGPR
ncbi:hypothetical protein [Nocardiopsis potens]|uniref:hypothetical protein n=1 Tax=Nocardiopsis potens TaxID=1246458 RepID=UPI00034A525F|nr:hypothetical protein [Nocardiopsis potens]